jgi:hypothetical protein
MVALADDALLAAVCEKCGDEGRHAQWDSGFVVFHSTRHRVVHSATVSRLLVQLYVLTLEFLLLL